GQPSAAVVDFRDSLEEATALARQHRGTEGTATQGAVASTAGTPDPTFQAPQVETAPIGGSDAPTQAPGAFQPVDDAPVTSEPLPEDELPAPLPEPID